VVSLAYPCGKRIDLETLVNLDKYIYLGFILLGHSWRGRKMLITIKASFAGVLMDSFSGYSSLIEIIDYFIYTT
jgi:hypothetical protein